MVYVFEARLHPPPLSAGDAVVLPGGENASSPLRGHHLCLV
jgi:hypothetical protein